MPRPRNFPDEETATVSLRMPTSLRDYLYLTDKHLTQAALDIIRFSRELAELLDGARVDLVLSAALNGDEYTQAKARTIARLVKVGLEAEKKSWPKAMAEPEKKQELADSTPRLAKKNAT